MNKDKYVFAQLIEFLDNNKFRHSVDKYDGNRYVKHFTYKYKDEKYHFAWQTWGYVGMYDNNWISYSIYTTKSMAKDLISQLTINQTMTLHII